LQVAAELGTHYEAVRFVSMDPLPPAGELPDLDALVDDAPRKRVELVQAGKDDLLECHEREVFFCSSWTTVLLWRAYAKALAVENVEPRPFYYFIQDYEPGRHPLGCRHAMALSAYGHGPYTHAIFDSDSLAGYFRRSGLEFRRSYVLPPALNPEIKAHLEARGHFLEQKEASAVRMLLHGGPGRPEHCFAAVMEGLYRFFSSIPEEERAHFYVISAGDPHDDLQLCPGAVVKSVGGLPMETYLKYLEHCNVGVSFMISPHPSHPPLEMALFGLYTITTSYGGKDLAGCHPNLHVLPEPTPEALAAELRLAAEFALSGGPSEKRAIMPSCLSEHSWRENVRELHLEIL
jgi:hypothetical protein